MNEGFDPNVVSEYELETWSRCADNYIDTFAGITQETFELLIEAGEIQAGSKVLDIGSGPGNVAGQLAKVGACVTGVDFSPVQIARARTLVPGATFQCQDMTQLDFPAASFDAVISLYAIFHVPLPEQPKLLADIRRWIKDDGYFLTTVGNKAWTGTESDWLGVQGASMYWSHADKNAYRILLADQGFTVLWDRFVPEEDWGHVLMLARAE